MAAEFHPSDFRRGLRHAGLTHGEFRVAVELCEYATINEPIVWPSVGTLAETCGMTRQGVQGSLRGLQAKGVVIRVTPGRCGRGQTNHWRLLVKRANESTPFLDEKEPTTIGPFGSKRANERTPKGPTKTHERANDGWPEVVRSREEVGNARASATPGPPPLEDSSGEEPPFHLTASGKVVCAKHIGTEGTDPCWPCGEARKAYEADCAAEAEAEHTRRTNARVQCNQCDPTGWRLDHGGRDGDTPKKCDHKQAS
jgi:hypothetical protein